MEIFVITYNTFNSTDALSQIVSTIEDNDPDIFFIALQELFYWNYFKYPIRKKGYTRSSVKMAGITSILLTKEKGPHKTLKIGMGFLGLPNKGFTLHKFKNTILINCHLAAHEHNNGKRLKMIDNIFGIVSNNEGIDTIVFAGDMNFRVQDTQENRELVKNKNFQELKLNDQGLIFKKKYYRFEEGNIEFEPTYKFILGENNYNPERFPSWCDRIFVASKYECKNLEYESLDYNFSDHKPVFSKFKQLTNIVHNDEILNNDNIYHQHKVLLTHFYCFIYDYWYLLLNLIILLIAIICFRKLYKSYANNRSDYS